jgi:hypothetical protein
MMAAAKFLPVLVVVGAIVYGFIDNSITGTATLGFWTSRSRVSLPGVPLMAPFCATCRGSMTWRLPRAKP